MDFKSADPSVVRNIMQRVLLNGWLRAARLHQPLPLLADPCWLPAPAPAAPGAGDAPGGTGTHSLPPDFLPGDLTVSDGVRELVVVGPKSEGMRFVRVIPAVRTFDGLRARIRDVRRVA